MNTESIHAFLEKHGMLAERIDPLKEAGPMSAEMEAGLHGGDSVFPMIPTYLRADGGLPHGKKAIVIDAGGTNFRCGLISFTEEGPVLSRVFKAKMPGVERPVTWEAFISFVADAVLPLADEADDIGFCFSYSAVITPEIDGRVICIDKEVVVTGSENRLVGASLLAELERRGVTGKHVVILNDTAAVLLGGAVTLDRSRCGGLIGQVSGTGTNTCCILPLSRIVKLGDDRDTRIIVNLESGSYDKLPHGDFDLSLDRSSHNPGEKLLEKLTSGVYLGLLTHEILRAAVEEGLLSAAAYHRIESLGRFSASAADAWANGEQLELCETEADAALLQTVSRNLFERSARAMCTNLLAILLLTGEGKDPEKPVVVCAEGSLVQKGRWYRPALERFLREGCRALGRSVVLKVGEETTLPGSAFAAVLNR